MLTCVIRGPGCLSGAEVGAGSSLIGGLDLCRSGPPWFTRLGSLVFFAARNEFSGLEVWRSDGTLDGTSLLVDAIGIGEMDCHVLGAIISAESVGERFGSERSQGASSFSVMAPCGRGRASD